MKKMQKVKGFTLIELMIVVAIIGILAAVAIPKFADLVTKSKEAAVKGTVGAVRSALSIYYGDQEGLYPTNLFDGLTAQNRYMPALGGNPSLGAYVIPKTSGGNPGHATALYLNCSAVGGVLQGTSAQLADDAGEAITFNTSDGSLGINCSHSDTKGVAWTAY